MNRRILGSLAILAAATGVVGYKWVSKSNATTAATAAVTPISARPAATTALMSNPAKSVATAYLFADPGEAECADGCSRLFHLVRAAAARGVRVREVDPGREAALVKEYQIRVQPTFIVLDSSGKVIARREGAAAPIIRAVRDDLDRLARAK